MAREDLEKFAAKRVSASVGGSSPSIFHYGDDGGNGPGVTHPSFQRTAAGAGVAPTGGASVTRGTAKPYHPLFSSPDRLQLPVQTAQLNQYWRLFYNVDPVIGGAIDMHGDMPWSGAYLVMDEPGDESQTILHAYEDMLNRTELLSWLPKLTREYMVIGEVFPFCFWDQKEGIFTHITLHNPDYVEVIDSPLVDDEPILTLRPTQDLRKILQSTDPRYARLRAKLPADILAVIAGGKNIPLDPLNASHLARRAFPYDIRGTSIMGRMFRILMYEDAVFNGQIQQAQRHALPLRVFKLGDQQRNWIPSPQNMEDFIDLLAEVESDPLAALVYHYGLQVEYHGMEGKQLKITQEWDVIERAKLIALGINKAFLHGEVTYASANAGLQVLMMRYRTLRDMVLSDWIYKKVFAVMAELNGFYRSQKKSDPDTGMPESRDPAMERKTMYLKDRMREIRAMKDEEKQAYEFLKIQPLIEEVNIASSRRFIAMNKQGETNKSRVHKGKHLLYPHLQFEKRLDVRQDEAILRFWSELAQKGWISPRSVVQGAGLDYDAEMATIGQDAALIARNQLLMQSISGDEGGGGGGGGVPMGGMGLGEEGGEGIGIGPGGGAGLESGEGSGAPGSAGGMSKAPASAVRDMMRKVSSYGALPDDVKNSIDAILGRDDTNINHFIKD